MNAPIMDEKNEHSPLLSRNEGSFTDLKELINQNTNGTLDLYRNYKFNSHVDSSLSNGIEINKNLVINGNNFVIDGNHESTIFKNSRSINYLIINNLSLINANSNVWGGACNFISVKNNITFNNVNFTNNFAKFVLELFMHQHVQM